MDILGLKRANCKSCHKCIRVCPVKSIEFSGQQAKIIGSECILCGQCVVTCPQNAKVVRSDVDRVKAAIAGGQRVVASLAPSFIVDFPVNGIEEMATMLAKLGFAETGETAMGAYLVKSEYERMVQEKRQDIIISTCCPSAVRLVQKYYPELVGCLAPVVSPMEAHARYIKEQDPDAVAVFIGPEGGFEEAEIGLALAEGVEPITLGKRILRTETAGLAVLSWMMYLLEA